MRYRRVDSYDAGRRRWAWKRGRLVRRHWDLVPRHIRKLEFLTGGEDYVIKEITDTIKANR